MPSEFDFINSIREQAARRAGKADDLLCGIGDDAAIVRQQAGCELLVTTDLLVEDVDFKLSYAPPRWLGHKALAVSLSDIAAMGGAPRFSLLTLGISLGAQSFQAAGLGEAPLANQEALRQAPQPGRTALPGFWEDFFVGYFALAEQHNVTLIGGDISATPDKLTIDSFVLGECTAGKAVRRSGARVGDSVYLTGAIGASAAGLKLLLLGARVYENRDDAVQQALRAHLRPEPRVVFGRLLGERGLASAMIDVSDGVAQDLAHICEESKVGAIIDFEAVPVAIETQLVTDNEDAAFALAISGGEDFELLFTASRADEAPLFELSRACDLRLTRIGEITEAGPMQLRRAGRLEPLAVRGYDHFSN